jgi:hypothetical protein
MCSFVFAPTQEVRNAMRCSIGKSAVCWARSAIATLGLDWKPLKQKNPPAMGGFLRMFWKKTLVFHRVHSGLKGVFVD